MKLATLSAAAAAVIAMGCAAPSGAAILYDGSAPAAGSLFVTADNITSGQNFLMKFTLSQTASVDGVSIWAYDFNATLPQSVTMRLRADAAGNPSTANLSEQTYPGLSGVENLPGAVSIVTLKFASLLLSPGSYWIGLSGARNLTQASFEDGGTAVRSGQRQLNGDVLSFNPSVFGLPFRVLGSVAPGPVPEPSTWALMIIGFALAGSGLRGRRRPAALGSSH